jgi:ribosomal protein S27E
MPFTPEQTQKIKEAILAKFLKPCPSCGQNGFTFSLGLIIFPTHPEPKNYSISGVPLRRIAVTCKTCGNTLFFDPVAMGIGDIFGPDPSGNVTE